MGSNVFLGSCRFVLPHHSLSSVTKAGVQVPVWSNLDDAERQNVLVELRTWLGDQQHVLDDPAPLDFMDVYVGPFARTTRLLTSLGKKVVRLGFSWGQDFRKGRDILLSCFLIQVLLPKHVWAAFPCTAWGAWSRLNAFRSNAVERRRKEAAAQLDHVGLMAAIQADAKRFFTAENPLVSKAWARPELKILTKPPFHKTRLDQCTVGLTGPGGNLMQKPTLIVSNCPAMQVALSKCCPGTHQHETCQGSATRPAENYPWEMARLVASVVTKRNVDHVDRECNLLIGRAGPTTYWLDAQTLKVMRSVNHGPAEPNKRWTTRPDNQATAVFADGTCYETNLSFDWVCPPKPAQDPTEDFFLGGEKIGWGTGCACFGPRAWCWVFGNWGCREHANERNGPHMNAIGPRTRKARR